MIIKNAHSMSVIFTLLMCAITISGCTQGSGSTSVDNQVSGGFSRSHDRNSTDNSFNGTRIEWTGRTGNLSAEARQKLFEERQKKATKACQGKNPDDDCQLDTPRGESKGLCKAMDGYLTCMSIIDNPARQRRQ